MRLRRCGARSLTRVVLRPANGLTLGLCAHTWPAPAALLAVVSMARGVSLTRTDGA